MRFKISGLFSLLNIKTKKSTQINILCNISISLFINDIKEQICFEK